MKKIVGLLAVAVLMSVSAFSQKPTYYAKVKKLEGIYLYVSSEPVEDYEILGTLQKKGLFWTGSFSEITNFFLKKCKKEYPKANGIIFSLSENDRRAVAIYIYNSDKESQSSER